MVTRLKLPPVWRRKGASWKEMVLTQPAVKFKYIKRTCDEETDGSIVLFDTKEKRAGRIYSGMADIRQVTVD